MAQVLVETAQVNWIGLLAHVLGGGNIAWWKDTLLRRACAWLLCLILDR